MATSRASFNAWMMDATRLIGLLSLCAVVQAATVSTSTTAAVTHTINVGQVRGYTLHHARSESLLIQHVNREHNLLSFPIP
jgi:hypothetical protein